MRPSANWRVVRRISYEHSSRRPESRNAASLKHLDKGVRAWKATPLCPRLSGGWSHAFWLSQRLASN